MLKIGTREIWLRSEAPDVAPDVWMMCAAGISLIHLISPGGLGTHPSPDLGEGAGETLPSRGLQNPGPQGTAAHPPQAQGIWAAEPCTELAAGRPPHPGWE